MKNYNQFLLEYLNKDYVKFHLKEILMSIKDIIGKIPQYNKEYNILTILNVEEKYEKEVEKVIKKNQRKIEKTGIFFTYRKSKKKEFNLKDEDSFEFEETGKLLVDFYLHFKELYIKRVKPTRYVYHSTLKSNRDSILENGLKTKENINYSDSYTLDHPPAVFATLEGEDLWVPFISNNGGDIWKIDTSKINNKWFQDLNIPNQKGVIMTYEDIPSIAIELCSR